MTTGTSPRKVCMLCDWARPEPRYLRLYCRKKQAIVDSEDSCPDWRDEWPKPDQQSTQETNKPSGLKQRRTRKETQNGNPI